MASIRENLEVIQQKIDEAKARANREDDHIQIVAVTKQVSVERAMEAIDAGIHHLGENRPEGLLEKKAAIGDKAVWHFIGTLQSRKVKKVINEIDYLHSLDRMSLAEEIEKRALKPVKCFVEVNISGEESKHGLSKEEAIPFIQSLEKFTKIQVVGLMTMAPYTDDKELIRKVFRGLKELQQEVIKLNLPYAPCTELSMGMSNDYEIAIEEGATFIRIGTALVG
ncbi:YggS family pyridoxal phosphate-dependent enzyme [Ureibacillus sp. FSL K6-8385]|uniref:Pyridoxal phosphate homeostasis protein n=1 Tax=Ureibacillus terrenus TaxID=118246 RepID=A0A540V4L9_9BACL|nr:YggS family pyridoxal phosphate-dependent enzyme [Ureibacillus terrenus]MED3660326.1 YggS family pyridoxal phosphate-dependent enzyme [Ureibacillus terrenus]MED3762482.1 YggS family pyridoxal phosphate-dependent enzyme [Ureibacillus terrenus]TQE91684.1 YggS family pyridoxal phosphate-dependent enzyme [Ureibacillus terrenus]